MMGVDIDGVEIAVANTDRYTADNRSMFEWSIDLDGEVYREADLKSGCGADPSEMDMLETLLGFLYAAAESYRLYGIAGDNAGLFPEPVVAWASSHLDDLSYAELDLQEAQEVRQLAYRWHGGQDTPLYAFASSGVVENIEWLLREIRRDCIAQDDEEAEELERLREFVEPVEGRTPCLDFNVDLDAWTAPWYGE
jgi:hypothetical protein